MPELFIVVGPNGSGKSSAIFETQIEESIIFVNPDDIAREEYADIEDSDRRNELAWLNCNAKRDALLAEGVTFGFETVGSHPSKIEFMNRAKELGYTVILLFVATNDPEINIRRIAARVKQGGHGVSDEKVRSRYYRTLDLLKDYFNVADLAFVWDNSLDANTAQEDSMLELVRKTEEGITVSGDTSRAPWVEKYLLPYIEQETEQ